MDNKVILGLGVAAAVISLLYYLTRQIDVDEVAPPPKPQPKPQPKPKPSAEEPKPVRQPQVKTVNPEPRSNDLVQFEDGVISTDSLLKVLATIKDRHMETMAVVTQAFREERRRFLHTSQSQYEAIVRQFSTEQSQLFDEVFSKTFADFGLSMEDVKKYDRKHGQGLFMSHLGRLMANTAKPVQETTLSADALAAILDEKVKILEDRLGSKPSVTPGDLLLVGFMVEDHIYEEYSVEDDAIQAAALHYKADPRVQQAQSKLKTFAPR